MLEKLANMFEKISQIPPIWQNIIHDQTWRMEKHS